MPTEPTRAPGNPPEASDGRRLHIHGIKEMPAGYDAEVADLFRDLRAASNLSEADLAATLATRLEVVQALEQGALYALPPWPETSRVVNSYGLLLNLDVRPLLRRIYAQIEPSSMGQDPYAMAEARPVPEPQAAPPRSPLDIPFEAAVPRRPQPYPEPQRAPQQNWAPPPVDRRMQPRAPGAPMPGGPMPGRPGPAGAADAAAASTASRAGPGTANASAPGPASADAAANPSAPSSGAETAANPGQCANRPSNGGEGCSGKEELARQSPQMGHPGRHSDRGSIWLPGARRRFGPGRHIEPVAIGRKSG